VTDGVSKPVEMVEPVNDGVGASDSKVGEYDGIGKYDGDVGEYDGDVGEYDGDVGE